MWLQRKKIKTDITTLPTKIESFIVTQLRPVSFFLQSLLEVDEKKTTYSNPKVKNSGNSRNVSKRRLSCVLNRRDDNNKED